MSPDVSQNEPNVDKNMDKSRSERGFTGMRMTTGTICDLDGIVAHQASNEPPLEILAQTSRLHVTVCKQDPLLLV